MKVRIKTWEEMEKEFGIFSRLDDAETYLALGTFCWHTELERIMPKDRIIEVKAKNELGEHYMVGEVYGISVDAIAEYLSAEVETDALDIEKTQDEDYIENLEFENRMFAEFLSGLGYSDEQISDIAMTGVRFNHTNSGD